MADRSYDWLDASLRAIHRAQWHRAPEAIAGRAGTTVTIAGNELLMFAGNNYLGLAGDERLVEAAIAATRTYGTGATGSRLVTGHTSLHDALEKAIADLKQTEAALVFSSGYLANLGTIAAIVGPRDLILADAYNHACLKNGAILSGARCLEYPHGNSRELAQLLSTHRRHYRRCAIVTDSVFSMDGDLCPLSDVVALADRYDCMVLVDEAHGTGVLGDRGGGLVEALGITAPLIQVGTLSKALGSLGGFVAGSSRLIDFLRNRCSTWIYTTGLSPADTAAALRAVEIARSEPHRRRQLWENQQLLKQLLRDRAIATLPTASPITAIPVRDIPTVLNVSRRLRADGIFAPAIRPPTVPSPRLRLTLMATHTQAQIEALARSLSAAWGLASASGT